MFLVQILHPGISAPKRTQMINAAAKLLSLKSTGLGEAFKFKDVRERLHCRAWPCEVVGV